MMMIDSQTIDGKYRLTAFGDITADMMKDFFDWMEREEIQPEDIWYADVFEFEPDEGANPERISVVKPQSEAQAEIIAKPDGKSPFRKRLRPIRGIAKRLGLTA